MEYLEAVFQALKDRRKQISRVMEEMIALGGWRR
jgi:hypothetical protein